jgi:hypothetical protein
VTAALDADIGRRSQSPNAITDSATTGSISFGDASIVRIASAGRVRRHDAIAAIRGR